jgi:uncharacterized protein
MPLHWGKAPAWLFQRMVKLCRAVTEIVVTDYGPMELLRRFSDPVWFQSFGCVLGFDWHSSGVTTTVCGALKEAVKGQEASFGLYVCGGKGGASRKTPAEITGFSEQFGLDGEGLVKASRLSAKVDSAALQDGFQIYQHVFIGTTQGNWAVVQQGMNTDTRWARRYHWLSEGLETFISEPHKGIACDHVGSPLNMVAAEVDTARQAVTAISQRSPDVTVREFKRVVETLARGGNGGQSLGAAASNSLRDSPRFRALGMPEQHPVGLGDVSPKYLLKALVGTYERPPEDFSALLLQPGIGPKTIRALALIAEVAHGAPLSFRDPVTYAFAVGGKDGWPYPVDRNAYDRSIAFLEKGIREAKLGNSEKLDALRRLDSWSRAVGAGSVTPSAVEGSRPSAVLDESHCPTGTVEANGLPDSGRDSSTPLRSGRNDATTGVGSTSSPQPSPLRGEGERSEGEEMDDSERKAVGG